MYGILYDVLYHPVSYDYNKCVSPTFKSLGNLPTGRVTAQKYEAAGRFPVFHIKKAIWCLFVGFVTWLFHV